MLPAAPRVPETFDQWVARLAATPAPADPTATPEPTPTPTPEPTPERTPEPTPTPDPESVTVVTIAAAQFDFLVVFGLIVCLGLGVLVGLRL